MVSLLDLGGKIKKTIKDSQVALEKALSYVNKHKVEHILIIWMDRNGKTFTASSGLSYPLTLQLLGLATRHFQSVSNKVFVDDTRC